MKLESITIRGVSLAFPEQVTLALRDLPPGIIAFRGENGHGKTLMLESFMGCAYQKFPSRDKKPYDYATRSDAFIETAFELEGQGLYKARLNLDGPHRRAEAVLRRVLPDGSEVFVTADSKVTTYDAEIAKILPPKELLLASVFAAQNRAGSFKDLDTKGRKALFATLLALDHYEQMAEKARNAAGLVEQAIEKLSAVRDVLAREAGEAVEADLEGRAQQLQAEGGQIEAQRAELQRAMAAIEVELERLAEAAAAYATATHRIDTIDADIRSRQGELDRAQRALLAFDEATELERVQITAAAAKALADLNAELADTSEHDAEMRRIEAALSAVIADCQTLIANNQEITEDAEAIRAAAADIRSIDAAIEELQKDLQGFADEGKKLADRERALMQTLAKMEQQARDLVRAQADARLLQAAPFGEKCAPCQFMTNAAAAKDSIPTLTAALAAKQATDDSLAQVRADIARVAKATAAHRTTIADKRKQRDAKHEKAQYLTDLDKVEERIAGYRQRMTDAEGRAIGDRAAATSRSAARLERLRGSRAALEAEQPTRLEQFTRRRADERVPLAQAITTLDALLAKLAVDREHAQLDATSTAEASARAAEQQALLNVRRREWDATTGELARVKAERAELARRVEAVRAKREELAVVDDRLADLRSDLVDYQILAKALGRDGLPLIEIDNAGPAVSALCNQLLQSTPFGARFSVELITQRAKATKGKDGSLMTDVFELLVWDAKDPNKPRDLTDLSGGQQVWVDEALKLAIALLVNTRNQFPIRTCWRDETMAALHPEVAPLYMTMLRKAHEIGGFHHTIVVSHNPDVYQQADAQFYFENGKVDLLLPPYEVAA